MEKPVELHEDVARSLRILGQAPMPEGMEDRIIGQMRQRQAELHSAVSNRGNRRRWMLGSAIAASAVVVGLVSQHHATPTATAKHLVTNSPGRETPQMTAAILRVETPANAVRVPHSPRVIRARVSQTAASAPSFNPPPLPLTQQERLLLAFAQAPRIGPALASVTASETVIDHGLGKNAVLELDHEDFKPLKTTLQPTQLSTLHKPNLSGENE